MSNYRVMWLLNHTTLRKFEISQFRDLGIMEVFTPKRFPYDEGNLSANVDFSLDENLTIPKSDLDILNAQDWYGTASPEAWTIANRYFDVAFVAFFPDQIKSAVRNFKGAIVLRVFGHARDQKYSQLLYQHAGERLVRDIKSLGRRFWFGAGYEHLHEIESRFLSSRKCFLPVGLATQDTSSAWNGKRKKVFFVCPRIGSSSHFETVYKEFKRNFGDLPYTIGGAQPVEVNDSNVVGFVSRDEHVLNMREHRVMFYHSQEPNHVHYHPFEAVAAGMPLVFLAGGMLDRLGGQSLPGRCLTINEARNKINRILNDDQRLISSIRESQHVLLDAISADTCSPVWQAEFRRVLAELDHLKGEHKKNRSPKIAVVVPGEKSRIKFQRAEVLAEAIHYGSNLAGEPAEVLIVFEKNEGSNGLEDHRISGLDPAIKQRTFIWKHLDSRESRRAMRYAGHDDWQPTFDRYLVIDDGIRNLQECDLWIIVTDDLLAPLLPLRTVVLFKHDCRHKYLDKSAKRNYLSAIRSAEAVFVNTQSAYEDALQYLGLRKTKVNRLPLLISGTSELRRFNQLCPENYFAVFVDLSSESCLTKIVDAFFNYIKRLHGVFECKIIAFNANGFYEECLSFKDTCANFYGSDKEVSGKISLVNNLVDNSTYEMILSQAAFLWCPDKSETAVFGIIEAASYGLPILCVESLAARDIVEQFEIGVNWTKESEIDAMARALKDMEVYSSQHAVSISSAAKLASYTVQKNCVDYWKEIRECL